MKRIHVLTRKVTAVDIGFAHRSIVLLIREPDMPYIGVGTLFKEWKIHSE